MDIEKLNLIRRDILSYPLPSLRTSDAFCGLYVDGTGKLTFNLADPAFHSFKLYSQYDYPVYLFVASSNDPAEIKKITEKYPNTKVYSIPLLKSHEEYNSWMFNYPWFLIDPKYSKILSLQDDGMLIARGWEEFVTKGDYNFIGAPWRSEIEALATDTLKPLWGFNGGFSYRTLPEIKKCVQFVNDRGGQHKFFRGVKINGQVRQQGGWLAEDLMVCSVGFMYGFLKDVKLEEARQFSHEPIELSLYIDKNNPNRPLGLHKIDF